MTAILFGSIGALADTSELQREAFNEAFAQHGLDWKWEQAEYRELLRDSGGESRIAAYARSRDEDVDAGAVHATKSELFQQRLREHGAEPRPGVVDSIQAARDAGARVALITTTSEANIAALGAALAPGVDVESFDLVLNRDDVESAKPAPDVYRLALERLNESPDSVVAIEDNVGGVAAATEAGVTVIAFPGENNADHDFSAAGSQVDELRADDLAILATSR